jgi:hypothetical protein
MTTNRRKRWGLALVAAATVMLAGCFGGGDDDDDQPAAQDPLVGVPESGKQSSAGFIAYLRTLVALTPETAEPFAIDGFDPPKVDNAEPEAL